MDDRPELINTAAAAEVLGVSVQTVRRWERSGHLRAVRTPGNHRRYDRAQVEQLLAMPPAEPTEAVG